MRLTPKPENGGPEPAPDPVGLAQRHARTDTVRRFYESVAIAEEPGGYGVRLDGKPLRTPARRLLVLPHLVLAERVAEEWAGQGAEVRPLSMPMTRLANAVIDGVVDDPAPVAEEAARFAGADLICYRAEGPDRLARRQAELWDPILAWARSRLGARFRLAAGVMHVAQDEATLAAVGAAVARLDPWRVAAASIITTLTGSVLIALALADEALAPEAAWAAAHVDEDWTIEHWGEDAEALRRRAARHGEFDAAVRVLAALRGV